MRRLLLTTAAIGLLALPAAAQQSPSGTSGQPGSSGAQMNQSATSQQTAATAQKVRQSLQQAGFQDINVVDAAYVVHARTSEGNLVLMYVDPPGGPTATTGSSGQSGSQAASQQQKLKEGLQKAGFKDVNVVDAAFLVNAKTADGSMVRMTINPPSMTTGTTGMGGSGSAGSGSTGSGSMGSSPSAPSSNPQR